MLAGLDAIEWHRLGHAYGSAADVPDQIRALRSPDPDVRANAVGELFTNIWHQGNRFEASAYAVPFLLELLADAETPDPEWPLILLTSLAIGSDENVLPDGFPVADYRRAAEGGRELLAGKPPPWVGDDESKKEYVEYTYVESLTQADQSRLWAYVALAAYDAVRVGVPLFRTLLLTHPDPGVRTLAAYALAWFPEDAAGSLPALATAAGPARSGGTRQPGEVATAVVAAGLLGVAPDGALLADPRPLVRWAAAVARARVLGADAGPATVDELLAWTAGSSDDVAVPFLDGDLSRYASLALRQVDPGGDVGALAPVD